MKIAILHGTVGENATPDELDVLVEVEAVAAALLRLGYDPVPVPLSIDLQGALQHLQDVSPVLVFNLVESVQGKGQFIHLAPTLLDYLQLPYTGARTTALFLTSHKVLAKHHLQAVNIATPPWMQGVEGMRAGTRFPFPAIIKSVWEHASIGLDEHAVVFDQGRLGEELEKRRQSTHGDCFVEAYIEGREFNAALLAGEQGPEVLPLAEIRFVDFPPGSPRVVGYRAKWDTGSFEYAHTPRCFDFPAEDRVLLTRLADIAHQCWRVCELRGYARVDFRVDREGRPWVLEINANPCISPDSGFVAAAERQGITYDQMIARIVRDAGLHSPHES
jgi:D-alanine-D-alanine ligase